MRRNVCCVLAVAISLAGAYLPADAAPLASVHAASGGVEWRAIDLEMGLVLTVSGPGGFHLRQELGAGEVATFSVFDSEGALRPSGTYVYELRAVPKLDDSSREALQDAREAGSSVEALRKAGKLPAGLEAQSGAFTIADATILMGGETEPDAGAPAGGNRLSTKDHVIADDLIVQGSACVGIDCVNGEDFGFDTIRVKENNTRIQFNDTSSSTGFPTNNWQIRANSSSSGGQNFLAFVDQGATGQSETGTILFQVTAGAPANSLVVDSTGRVGLRTATPVLDLHVSTTNTPAMRLEQTNAGGFTAQTWDIAGNEANFFVRDVTGGSRLPLRIRPGAPTSSVDIAATGNVGIGTASASQPLHVVRSDGTTKILVEETSTTEAARELAQFQNNGTVTYRFTDTQGTASTSDDSNWISGLRTNNQFIITLVGTIGSPLWSMDSSGNVTATSFNPTSSRALKEDFAPVEPKAVLDRVLGLPISEWRYREDVTDALHLGPVAEDFRAAFGLGQDDRHISLTDLGGVSLAAIQGLHQQLEERTGRLASALEGKEDEIERLQTRVSELETAIRTLTAEH